MVHPLVTQLRFARKEFVRCTDGVSTEDAILRIKPMNCISWIVGHLASQEHYLWVEAAQGKNLAPGLYKSVGYGQPASTPRLDEMWELWHSITSAADTFLETLTAEQINTHMIRNGQPMNEDIGTSLLRNMWHYWFHLGEAHAIRQMLGHKNLPQFVGNMSEVLHHE